MSELWKEGPYKEYAQEKKQSFVIACLFSLKGFVLCESLEPYTLAWKVPYLEENDHPNNNKYTHINAHQRKHGLLCIQLRMYTRSQLSLLWWALLIYLGITNIIMGVWDMQTLTDHKNQYFLKQNASLPSHTYSWAPLMHIYENARTAATV